MPRRPAHSLCLASFWLFGCASDGASHADAAHDNGASDGSSDAAPDSPPLDDSDARVPEPPIDGDAAADGAAPIEPPGTPGPTNVSFETARRLEPDGSSLLQDELSADQVDFYVFEVEPDAYYEVTTDRHNFSPDNILAVYDQERTLIAANDYGSRWSGDAVDARVIVHAERASDFYVRVEDLRTPPRFFESDFPLLYYHLSVRRLEPGSEGVAIAGEQQSVEIAPLTDEVSGFRYATLIGRRNEGQAVFSIEGGGEAALGRVLREETPVQAQGPAWRAVELVDADENVIASILEELGQEAFHPPVSDARYELRVTPEDAIEMHDDFYAIDLVLIPENPLEAQDLENGTPEGAEPIEMEGDAVRRGLLLSTLPSDDVDHYSFDAQAGERALVFCEAESGGSRLRGLHAELLDGTLAPLGEGEESPTTNLEIEAAVIERTGTHYLRLSTESHDALGFAAWVRCAVTVLP